MTDFVRKGLVKDGIDGSGDPYYGVKVRISWPLLLQFYLKKN